MSKSSNTGRNIGLLFVFAVCVGLVCADLVVSSAHGLPQNANSSTTQEDETTRGGMMTSGNANSAATNTNTGTSRRRRNRRNRRNRAANTNTSGDMSNMNMSTDTTATGTQDSGVMSDSMSGDRSGTQTDLSGTYTGTVNFPEGGLNGPATLTISGNNFTMAPDGGGSSATGRVTAVTTRGYTAVTMLFGDTTPPPVTQAPPPLPIVSLRARMSGGRITLTSVPGEKREFSFSSAGAGSGGTRRGRRNRTRRNVAAQPMMAAPDETRGGMEIKPPTATSTPTP